MEEKITEVLKSVGITGNEISVYLDLFRNPNSTAQEISKRVKIYRSNAYEALRRLKTRGLVSDSKIENSTVFNTTNPESLLEYIKQQENEISQIIPHLKNIEKNTGEEESCSISYGLNSFRNAMLKLLDLEKELYFYNIPPNIVDFLGGGFVEEFHRERLKKKTPINFIFSKETPRVAFLNKMPYTNGRFLTGEHESIVSTLLCCDLVYILIFEHPYKLIKIKSQRVADSYKEIFKVLWEQSKFPAINSNNKE